MQDPQNRDGDDRHGSPRGRAVVLALLPSAFLGAAYFLLVEYLLSPGYPDRLSLRIGGAALIAISLLLAAACGYSLAERFLRPLRLLLRLGESGEVQPGSAPSLRERGREYVHLHRLLRVLVSQNQTGARAMEELDLLRAALARLREEISRTGLHGIPPEVTTNGPLREIAVQVQAKRHHLLSFFRDLHERMECVRQELVRLGAQLGLDGDGAETRETAAAAPPAPAETTGFTASLPAAAAVGTSLERLRRLGTVLALESARAGGAPARRAAEMLDQFHAGLGELEATLEVLPPFARGNGDPGATEGVEPVLPDRAELRESWRRLLDSIESIERRLEEVEER